MSDFKDKLKLARLPERTVRICLRGDLVGDHEAAERELEQAQKRVGDSLAGNGVSALVERIEALQAEMAENSHTFRLRALPKPRWRALLTEHAPRRDDTTGDVLEADSHVGVNTDTFYEALIRACLVDPVLDDDDWAQLLDVVTDRQYDDLASAAWLVNRSEVDIPFSRAASRAKRATADE